MSLKKKRRKEIRYKKRAAAVLIVCLVLAASFTVYSKYYKTGYNKGMAVASGFYFDGNYMKETELDGIGSIEELVEKPELVNRLPVAANDKTWSDTVFQFAVEVRNYTNQLLYNDKDLNISYTVEFALLDEPKGAVYEIRKGTEGSYTMLNPDASGKKKITFEGSLQGGKLSWDTYDLKVSLNAGMGTDYVPARILVLAYPTAPSYLTDTKKIAGIITADYNQRSMEITEQKFTIEDHADFTDAGWQDVVKKESAFVYQLKTTGNYSDTETGGMGQKIQIKWNPALYELNQNDKYLAAEYIDSGSTQYRPDEGIMVIETMPYSSIRFVFFKKAGFDAEVDGMTMEEFKASIQAEKLD